MTNQLYTYFVSYAHTNGQVNGTGMTTVSLVQPIRSWADIELVTKFISVNTGTSLTITGYQLMSGPDTCGTCGK